MLVKSNQSSIRIFVPFTNLRAPVMLAVPDATFCPIVDKFYGYGQYFKERWNEKQTFINIEHDVVPRIELLKEMWNCSEPLCVAGYCSSVEGASGTSHIGCAKISASLILKSLDLFDTPCEWIECEGRIGALTDFKFCYHGEVHHLKGT
jgi:hypothetical protein